MGDRFGGHRVLEPVGALPQAALRLDPCPKIEANEIGIDVTALQPTATAFGRIKNECGNDPEIMKSYIKDLVARQGKFQDPVTKSGGVLMGRVREIGDALKDDHDLMPGDKIATLVSLSLTPLSLTEIDHIDMETEQVRVTGTAVLFESGLYAELPEDIPESLAMAVLDVAGAPAQVRVNVTPGQVVVVVGAGKAGLLCLAEAMDRVFPHGRVVCLEYEKSSCERVRELGLAHHVIQADATVPLETLERYRAVMGDRLADFTVNCVNVGGTEVTSALVTKNRGQIYFFSMNTDFAKAALGVEGIGKETRMIIGNGYYPGHAQITFRIIRSNPGLYQCLESFFVR